MNVRLPRRDAGPSWAFSRNFPAAEEVPPSFSQARIVHLQLLARVGRAPCCPVAVGLGSCGMRGTQASPSAAEKARAPPLPNHD